ncbi:hypothetical protein [Hydrogenimonas urashimensis]|uniref:hypothetical protein n=1 Tax=Hydrogenimonas urashimensis TaxID=2740515 RepID=UPI0019165401|nr:hypothetical protein [Hydrogenimonas urashimensis]
MQPFYLSDPDTTFFRFNLSIGDFSRYVSNEVAKRRHRLSIPTTRSGPDAMTKRRWQNF